MFGTILFYVLYFIFIFLLVVAGFEQIDTKIRVLIGLSFATGMTIVTFFMMQNIEIYKPTEMTVTSSKLDSQIMILEDSLAIYTKTKRIESLRDSLDSLKK